MGSEVVAKYACYSRSGLNELKTVLLEACVLRGSVSILVYLVFAILFYCDVSRLGS